MQDRAVRRREAILDATARLLDRQGFGAVTTNAVATEASASIGTIYDYFPNKEALFVALLERYRERLSTAVGRAVGDATVSWRDVADRTVDAFYDFYASEPGYRELWLGAQLSELLVTTGQRWGEGFGEQVAELLALYNPSLPEKERRLVALTAVHMVSSLVTVACQHRGAESGAIVREAKLALRRYLEPLLDPLARRTRRPRRR